MNIGTPEHTGIVNKIFMFNTLHSADSVTENRHCGVTFEQNRNGIEH